MTALEDFCTCNLEYIGFPYTKNLYFTKAFRNFLENNIKFNLRKFKESTLFLGEENDLGYYDLGDIKYKWIKNSTHIFKIDSLNLEVKRHENGGLSFESFLYLKNLNIKIIHSKILDFFKVKEDEIYQKVEFFKQLAFLKDCQFKFDNTYLHISKNYSSNLKIKITIYIAYILLTSIQAFEELEQHLPMICYHNNSYAVFFHYNPDVHRFVFN